MKKDLLLRIKEIVIENRNINIEQLLSDKSNLSNELDKINNELKKYKIEYLNEDEKSIVEKFNKKSKNNIIALVIGIPALLGLSLLSKVFVYLLFCYVVANCVMINVNEMDKLQEISSYKDDKEYFDFRRDMNNGIFRVDVMELECKKDIIDSKIKSIDKKLSKYRSNVSEMEDIEKQLSEIQTKEKLFIKRK